MKQVSLLHTHLDIGKFANLDLSPSHLSQNASQSCATCAHLFVILPPFPKTILCIPRYGTDVICHLQQAIF